MIQAELLSKLETLREFIMACSEERCEYGLIVPSDPTKPNASEMPEFDHKTFTLKQLQKAIGGGYIEIVRIPGAKFVMIVDEEGKLKNFPMNAFGSALYGSGINHNDWIVGDIFLVPNHLID
jgi:hypothetical protein